MNQLLVEVDLRLKQNLVEVVRVIIRIEGAVGLLVIPRLYARNNKVLGSCAFNVYG